MDVPPREPLDPVLNGLRSHGLVPAVGGSGLLVALGLAETAHDWDVTVDAPTATVAAVLDELGVRYRDRTRHDAHYATRRCYVIDAGDHAIDLLVGFAMRGTGGIVRLPSRVTGYWRGLPLADPEVWARAYRLLGRPAKADALDRWLARRAPGSGS